MALSLRVFLFRKMKTKEVQNLLLKHLSKRPDFFVLTTNLSWFLPFEADVFQITKNRLIVEYEIKVSRADFLKDIKKNKIESRSNLVYKYDFLKGVSKFKTLYFQIKRPHKFYFVAPFGIIKKDEIPKEFGLIEIYESNQVCINKHAKQLHAENLASDDLVFEISRNFCLKQCNNE